MITVPVRIRTNRRISGHQVLYAEKLLTIFGFWLQNDIALDHQ